MWQDPIVAETRALREEYAKQFEYDAEAIFQDILHRQNAPGKKTGYIPCPQAYLHTKCYPIITKSDIIILMMPDFLALKAF